MKALLASITIILLAAPAFAVLSLPIAEKATTHEGEMHITGAVTLESDVNLYGGRFSYGIRDGVSVFVGAGLWDPDFGDSEIYLQGGGKFTLPVDLPVDLAIRGALGYVNANFGDLMTFNGGLLASMQVDPRITVYGFGGLSHWRWSFDSRFLADASDTELAIAGGGIFNLNENVSLFGELAHIDDLFVSLGVRFTL